MAVYFAVDGRGLVKIGTSRYPDERLQALRATHGCQLNFMRVVDGSRPTERWLHRRFRDLRVWGEWFEFHSDMLTITMPDEIARPRRGAVTTAIIRKIA